MQWISRWVRGVLPPNEGGPPPALTAARAQISGWVVAAIGLLAGIVVGFALVLVAMALPNWPASVVGLVVGALLGSSVALTLASKFPFVRRAGGIAILLAPLLLLAAPFLLIAAAIALLRRTSSPPGTPPAAPLEPQVEVEPAKPRRRRRKLP